LAAETEIPNDPERARRLAETFLRFRLALLGGFLLIVAVTLWMIVRAVDDARFRDVANRSALSLCDTVGVLYAARLLHGVRVPERVAGIDLLDPLCAELARAGLPVYLCGGKGDTAQRAAQALQARHAGLTVAGARDGYFPAADDARVAAEIAASGARVLLLGLGSPRQEIWISEHLSETGARVGIGIGGSFDVLAGNVKRAPDAWRKLSLEWLYRLLSEPARWRRQLALPRFVWLAVCERVVPRFRRRFS